MSTVSIPLDEKAMRDLSYLRSQNPEMTTSAIVRKAIRRLSEEEAVNAVLQSQNEITTGQIIRQDAATFLRSRMKRK